MVWVLRPADRGPPRYDFSSRYFTIKMHHGGQFGGIITQTYIGGSVSSFDYCHSDELSLIELSHMGKELGYGIAKFYQKVRGEFVFIAKDQDVMDFGLGFDVKKRVVQIYVKHAELTNVVGGTHFSTFPKCDILLNNLCESFNSAILIARDQSIISMLERIRHILTDMVVKRREAMEKCMGDICPKIYKLVEKMKGHVGEWVTTYTSNNKYEVSGPGRQYKVDLEHKICGCRRWDLNGIPCIHAVAAYSLFDQEPLDHVHQCYSKATYLKTYENMLAPLNGKELWTTSLAQVMLPPDVCKRAGRPKKARTRDPEEATTVPPDPTKLGRKGTKMKCSKCGVQGHNKRSCKTKEPVREQSAHGTSGVVHETANAAMGSGIKLPKTKPNRAPKLTVRRQMKKTKHKQVEQNKRLTLSQPHSQVDDPVPN